MESVKVSKVGKGKCFLKRGDKLRGLFVILQGSVRAIFKNDEIDLEPGSIIGMMEGLSDSYLCDYVANTDCLFYIYPYRGVEDYKKIFEMEGKYVAVFAMSAMHQASALMGRYAMAYRKAQEFYKLLMGYYGEYKKFCGDYGILEKPFKRMGSLTPVQLKEPIGGWVISYYKRMSDVSLKSMDQFLARDSDIGIGAILNAVSWMKKAISMIRELKDYLYTHRELLLSSETENLFQLYFELARKASSTGIDISALSQKISGIMDFAAGSHMYEEKVMKACFEEYESYDFNQEALEDDGLLQDTMEEYEEGFDYLSQILEYAGYPEDKAKEFRSALEEYKELPDLYASTDNIRKLRRVLTQAFYDIYELAFFRSLKGGRMPVGVKMFMNFGFVDEGLAGEENARSLYDMTEQLYRCKAENVFTIYEWLLSIFRGENEPSRNEFDMDYMGFLNEQKKTGDIKAEDLPKLQNDNRKKVEFELRNMFVSTNRATYGRISTYCPILCEDDIVGSAEKMLMTAEKANGALDEIRKIDYSLFYREVGFSDPEREVNREVIQKEIIPYIILMPNAGTKAMMWQETAGIRKDTQARFIFPILTGTDVSELMVDVAGRFRWEMCRKIQGARWNDITEASLTSEYSDYIQYYRKNSELSADAKDKVKKSLQKAKNNYREVFVKDYQSWIRYESKGSFRLNKVARDIIFRYCPFSKDIRKTLSANPTYQEMFGKFEILNGRKAHHVEAWYDRYQKKGGEITEDLQMNLDFYSM
ncbi:MAG: cyclic nucleotide-binding domain-containing protein [Lachnospiraceae bacterium]|jgi:hypothetical protein|nr:cyclic nucleotide-binding domain-containing protein [Lachnospiraceae bacterium]